MINNERPEKAFLQSLQGDLPKENQGEPFFNDSSVNPGYSRVWSLTPWESKPPTIKKAGFGIRSIAYVIDRIILTLIDLLFFVVGLFAIKTTSYIQTGIPSFENFTTIFIPTYAAMLLVEIAYYTFFHGHTGQTIGKMVCGVKVINIQGEIIGYRRAFLRWVGYVISSLIFYLGFLWVAIDRSKQGWHDKIARTYVIKV